MRHPKGRFGARLFRLGVLALTLPHCGGVTLEAPPDDGVGGSSGSAGAPTGDAGGQVPDGTAGAGGSSVANGGTGGGNGGTGGAEGGAPANLMPDPGFESGQGAWAAFGTCSVQVVSDGCHGGSQCLRSMDRTETWQGPARHIEAMLTPGQTYEISAWVRSSEATPQTIGISTKTVCENDNVETYTLLTAAAVGSDWVQLTGTFAAPTCRLTELLVYFDGSPAQTELFIDDVTLMPAD